MSKIANEIKIAKKTAKQISSLVNGLEVALRYCSACAATGDFETFEVFFKQRCRYTVQLAELGIELPGLEYAEERLSATPEEFARQAKAAFKYEREELKK